MPTDPTVRAVGTVAKGNVTALTVTIPAAAQVGDLLLFVGSTNNIEAPGLPAGWTIWRDTGSSGNAIGATNGMNISVLGKACVAGNPGSTVTYTNTSNVKKVAVILAIRDANPLCFMDCVSFIGRDTTMQATHAWQTLQTQRQCRLFAMVADRATGATFASGSFTYPAGFTDVVHDRSGATSNTNDVSLGVAIGPVITQLMYPSPTGLTWTGSDSNNRAGTVQFGVRSSGIVYPQLDWYAP